MRGGQNTEDWGLCQNVTQLNVEAWRQKSIWVKVYMYEDLFKYSRVKCKYL